MEIWQVLLLVVGLVVVVFGGMCIVIPALIKRGVDISGLLSDTATAVDVAQEVVDAVQDIFGESPGLDVVETIIDYAEKGVEAAEQLYISHQLEGPARKERAKQLVKDMLTIAGIEITPEVEKVVDGCIEAAVLTMPETHEGQKPGGDQ